MFVLKFGGTSVGNAKKIKEVAQLISNGEEKIVVLSAMSGTTNDLVEIAAYLYKKEKLKAKNKIMDLRKKYKQVVLDLFNSPEYIQKGNELIDHHFNYIESFMQDMFTLFEEKAILAQGEMISTALMHYHLKERGVENSLLPALDFMRIDKENEPDNYYIKVNLERELKAKPEQKLFITQGYICRDAYGEIDNLKRGGSDYTASLIGAAIKADEIQIWTDIDGFHNNDPRYVENTQMIENLSFDEAAELAYFGAKILHPTSVRPAKDANIPVRLKNTMNPSCPGTLITSKAKSKGIKAIAAKDGITALKIQSGRMLLAYGFLRKVFEIFESYKTPIDMITTSEVSVSVSIDDPYYLIEIKKDLERFGQVEVYTNQSIICVVGNLIAEKPGVAMEVLKALKDIPIRMISYGGSENNISLMVAEEDKVKALNKLEENLF